MNNLPWEAISVATALLVAVLGGLSVIGRWLIGYGALKQRVSGVEQQAIADRQAIRQEMRETRLELSTRIDDVMKLLLAMQQPKPKPK